MLGDSIVPTAKLDLEPIQVTITRNNNNNRKESSKASKSQTKKTGKDDVQPRQTQKSARQAG